MPDTLPDASHSQATIIHHDTVPLEHFPGGATYRTLVGDDQGSSPVRIGIQSSPPGYATPFHSHPYTEILTVLEGEGVAWMEDSPESQVETPLKPGMTMVLPAHVRHGFRVTGKAALVTYGLHVSPDRVVHIHDGSPEQAGYPK